MELVLSFHSGVAVPEGEAHRHEPPIPHDQVQVDTRKNIAELEEDNKQLLPPAGGHEEGFRSDQEQGLGHAVEVGDKKEEEKQKPVEVPVKREEVDLGGGEVLSNEVFEKLAGEAEKKQKDGDKLDAVKDHLAAVANQNVVEQDNKVDIAAEAAGKREYLADVFL